MLNSKGEKRTLFKILSLNHTSKPSNQKSMHAHLVIMPVNANFEFFFAADKRTVSHRTQSQIYSNNFFGVFFLSSKCAAICCSCMNFATKSFKWQYKFRTTKTICQGIRVDYKLTHSHYTYRQHMCGNALYAGWLKKTKSKRRRKNCTETKWN